ncbi:MAG TPA: helix-turn-helix domain-containing protein [Candidatus Acidoferrum sp.]|jgi:transcriptional regulator with XRE-family HTH domain|nr:helix-turn-helix domain-containing protein [Candidatus Acidoferrum sp.]
MNGTERRARLGAFLKAKRAQAQPDQFDLPIHRRRRVAGLRREEVAMLAGISVTWYTQLEGGAPITVSPGLLRRLSEVLQLSGVERAFLFSLAIDDMAIMTSVLCDLETLAHPQICAASLDAEIAMALRTHRSLKAQIYGGLLHGTVDQLRPHLDEERCPIGLWLHDDLGQGYRTVHYDRAARIHAAFHREIERVVDARLSGAARAEHLIAAPSRYVRASAALEHAFTAWRAHLGGRIPA